MVFSGLFSGLGDAISSGVEAASDAFSFSDIMKNAPSILSGASGLAEVFTSSADKKRAQTPQFARMPIEDVLSDFTKYREFLSRNMTPITLPTRRMTATEMNDPIFGNQSMTGLQAFADERARALAAQGQAQGKPSAGADMAPAGRPGQPSSSGGYDYPAGVSQQGDYSQYDEWTPYNEEADVDFIRRLTGGLDVLPGWNPETKTYTMTGGVGGNKVQLHGQEGYRRAEDDAVRKKWEELNPDPNRNIDPMRRTKLNKPLRMPGITGQAANYENPFGGGTYNRRRAIEAMLAGDKNEMHQQSKAAHYNPKPGFLDKIGAVAKPLLMSAILAPGFGSALGAAGLGSTAAKIGSRALTSGANRVVA